jgi:ankyrin repeat protein
MDAILLDPGSRNSLADAVQPSGSHSEQVTTPNFEGTSLHTASSEGNVDAVRWLLCHGGDVNKRDEIHKTPLCVASRNGKLDVAKELIKNGAGVDLGDKFGWTPLHEGSRNGHLDIVLLLLDHSANVNATQQDGWSSLHLAAANSHIEIVQLLLERGAKAEIRNPGWSDCIRRGIAKRGVEDCGIIVSVWRV